MTNDPASPGEQGADHGQFRTTAAWFPAADERLRVSRTIMRSSVEVARALHVRPDQLVRVAYNTEITEATGAIILLSPVKSQRWLRVPARVELLTPPPQHPDAIISLRWQAARLSRLFPVLEADLAVRPAAGGTELRLDATYRPPLGIAGLVFDHLVGRRIATAATVGFVDALAVAIERDELPGVGS
ncbi:MAG TPA: hypothetical protein VMU75_00030 [Acidimicrobiales bacterium]|nr:hypothetical protein [Acidimicrobiales bacterium]